MSDNKISVESVLVPHQRHHILDTYHIHLKNGSIEKFSTVKYRPIL